jgi:predicted transcriptional regulator
MAKNELKKADEKMLTDVELELMVILWKLGEGSVSDVLSNLAPDRALAYTSVSTILRILEQKSVLRTRKEGRGHIYTPTFAKSEYETKALKHVVERVFEGTPAALVKQLLCSGSLSAEDLAEVHALIIKASHK